MLIGEDAVARLSTAHVALFGLGGVGGYALETLVRAGVGTITVVDDDTVSPSNLNRQILATLDSIGKDKTEVALKRATSISPTVKIIPKKTRSFRSRHSPNLNRSKRRSTNTSSVRTRQKRCCQFRSTTTTREY